MYFPVSDIVINPLYPPLIAFCVSFFCSMGGISGAFLLLPYQVSVLGITSPGVSATNHFFNVIATPSGLFRYIREKRFVWPLTWIIILGTIPGLIIGIVLRMTLFMDIGWFKVFVGLVLIYIGLRLVAKRLAKSKNTSASKQEISVTKVLHWSRKEFVFSYGDETYACSTPKLLLLSLIIGVIGGIYGVGGGAIIAPFLVAVFKFPIHVIGGSTLLATFITSLWGSVIFRLIAPFYPGLHVSPDIKLGLLLGIGGVVGMYCGARCQKYVPAKIIERGLAIVTIITGVRYLLGG